MKWLSGMDAQFAPLHIMNGRLTMCMVVAVIGVFVTGAPLDVKASLFGEERLLSWRCAAVGGGVLSVLTTFLAEDFARILETIAPFSLWRWLLAFAVCFICTTVCFRFAKTSRMSRFALAVLPALALASCRWLARYSDAERAQLGWLVMMVFALALEVAAKGYWRQLVPSIGFAALFALFAAGGTFLWCYNKVVYDARTIDLGLGGVAFLLLAFLLMASVGLCLLAFLTRLRQWLEACRPPATKELISGKFPLKLFFGMLCIMGAVWMLWWLAYRPGNLSPDSVHQWRQALGLTSLEDSHPILSTLFLVPFAHLNPSPALFTAFQVWLCAGVCAAMLAWWNRQGVPAKLCLALAVVIALLPGMGIYAVTLWKDIPFCLAVLWLGFLLARLVHQEKFSWGFAAETVVAMVVAACFRHNGIVIAIMSGAVLLGVGLFKHKKQVIAGVVAAFLLIVFIQGPLYSLLGVPHYRMGLAGLAVSSIGSVMAYEADIPADIAQEAEAAMPREAWVDNFNPYNSFAYAGYELEAGADSFLTPYRSKSAFEVVGMWLRLFVKNPLVMFQERMAMCDSILFVDQAPHPDAHSYPYRSGIYQNDMGLSQQETTIHQFFEGVLAKSEATVQGRALLWRNGIWWMVCLWLLYFNFLQKQGLRNVYFVPMLANVLTLLLAITEQGYRYTWVIIPWVLFGTLLAALPSARTKQSLIAE